jgi:hypothetical protein
MAWGISPTHDDLVDLNAGERAVLLQPKRHGADLVEMIRRGPDLNAQDTRISPVPTRRRAEIWSVADRRPLLE